MKRSGPFTQTMGLVLAFGLFVGVPAAGGAQEEPTPTPAATAPAAQATSDSGAVASTDPPAAGTRPTAGHGADGAVAPTVRTNQGADPPAETPVANEPAPTEVPGQESVDGGSATDTVAINAAPEPPTDEAVVAAAPEQPTDLGEEPRRAPRGKVTVRAPRGKVTVRDVDAGPAPAALLPVSNTGDTGVVGASQAPAVTGGLAAIPAARAAAVAPVPAEAAVPGARTARAVRALPATGTGVAVGRSTVGLIDPAAVLVLSAAAGAAWLRRSARSQVR